VAYTYNSFVQDTLRAIRICFNDSYLNANKREFDLMVWDDNNGIPGNVIFSQEEVMVEQGTLINGFYTYSLPEGVMVNKIFYIGWKQRTETFLNAGFDINTPHKGRQFYWLNGEWQQSQVNGSIMIRPVVGEPLRVTAVNDILYKNRNLIKIWPNPAADYITIDPGEQPVSGLAYISVTDLSGREMIRVPFTEQLDISTLRNGIYIVITSLNGKTVGYNRLIKSR
jgi:Secretion system C-terminal sorting domain